jgi:hypothetical protein
LFAILASLNRLILFFQLNQRFSMNWRFWNSILDETPLFQWCLSKSAWNISMVNFFYMISCFRVCVSLSLFHSISKSLHFTRRRMVDRCACATCAPAASIAVWEGASHAIILYPPPRYRDSEVHSPPRTCWWRIWEEWGER